MHIRLVFNTRYNSFGNAQRIASHGETIYQYFLVGCWKVSSGQRVNTLEKTGIINGYQGKIALMRYCQQTSRVSLRIAIPSNLDKGEITYNMSIGEDTVPLNDCS